VLVRLLGPPHLESNGARRPGPRGHKAWGLFAYLVLSRRPASRRQLTDLLFADAEDPLAALRWNLAELRRSVGRREAFAGDPIELRLAAGTEVDVQRVLSARPEDLATLDGLDGELLLGLSFPSSPGFEAWLAAERRRVAMAVEAVLRERVLLQLAGGRADQAPRTAARLVAANPLEEAHHELLIRSLLAAGDRAAAAAHVAACAQLFRRELGIEPSRRLQDLVRMAAVPAPRDLRVGGTAAARAQLEAGRAALAAGAVEVGIEFLRRACREAAAGDDLLCARALLALGSALVHSMRGHEEGAATLHRAAEMARRLGTPSLAATAYREIGFIDVQAGRRERAEVWLARAEEAADDSSEELAAIYGVRGMNLSDAACYPEAIDALDASIGQARRGSAGRQTALSTSLLGRVHLLRGHTGAARDALTRSLRQTEDLQWVAFQPWPESLLAEVDLAERALEPARERLEHAFTLACQLGDSCWEGVAARGLGVVEARHRRTKQALAWLIDARARCVRSPSPYQWVHGWILDTLSATALDDGDARAAGWVEALDALATRGGMRQFLVSACLHRGRLGDPRALEAARLLAAGIDSPSLDRSIAAGASHARSHGAARS
jgi:DNA-binding SARP family transcriptional activator